MLKESVEEYREICAAVRDASSAVMRYSSATVAASGVIFAAIASLEIVPNNSDSSLLTPIMLFTLANVTLFVQLIINYKCASHNRMAAYRNLIASEKLDDEAFNQLGDDREVDRDQLVGFGICMNYLNKTYAEGTFDFNDVKGKFFARKGVFRKLTGRHDVDLFVSDAFPHFVKDFKGELVGQYGTDRHDRGVRRWTATLFFARLVLGLYDRKGTWGFPDQVNRIAAYIVAAELAVAIYFSSEILKCWESFPMATFAIIAQTLISFRLIHLVSVEWQELMFGGKRIFSYYVQFVPFRMICVKQMFGFDADDYGKEDDGAGVSYFVGSEWELDSKRGEKL